MLQLLWIETLLKLVFGLVLASVPLTAAHLFGLSRPDSGFWPRLLGGVLIGLAGATFLEGWVKNAHGLGLGGCLVINLAAAAILFALVFILVETLGYIFRGLLVADIRKRLAIIL